MSFFNPFQFSFFKENNLSQISSSHLWRKRLLLLFYGCLFALSGATVFGGGSRLQVSPVLRHSNSVRFRAGSCAGTFGLPSGIPSSHATSPPLDNLDYGDRQFDDGYVRKDPGTGLPDSLLPDSTWNWGYQNGEQYDATAKTITFRKNLIATEQYENWGTPQITNGRSTQGQEHYGLELSLEYPLKAWKNTEFSVVAGWQWIPSWEISESFPTFHQVHQNVNRTVEATDLYKFQVFTEILPAPGHAGTYKGPFDTPPAPGALISNRPIEVARQYGNELSSTGSAAGTIYTGNARLQLTTEQQEIFFGPVFRWMPAEWISVSLSPRLNFLYTSAELKRTESLLKSNDGSRPDIVKQWKHQRSTQRLLPGTSLACSLECNFRNGFFGGISFATSWYPEKIELHAGPGEVTMRPGALSSGILIGYRF